VAKKQLTDDKKWEIVGKMLKFERCTLTNRSVVIDGIVMPIGLIDRPMFNDATDESEVIGGEIVSQDGPFLTVNVEGEIIKVELV
jgi:hypothetical protein